MSRDDILDRILYSHYLEQLYATATGRIDKLLLVLIFIFGSAVVLKANPFIFGVLIVALTAIQITYQFGRQSGEAKKRASDYLKLYTLESKYNDDDLKDRMIELESRDETIWSSLHHIAILKTQIKIDVVSEQQIKLTFCEKSFRLLCG
ncbi:hypothetical protein KKI90_22225 [Xenorhabdus bovienii]|uniref:hypothetical protein n=1 Tax=Xenorhabdus bovienii TaxID=40576 RepID=UPI00237CB6B6|nr:hypothetical protein [Xenorhabdus bovienii]MDE1488944.1 hypothetical protein [Xenorhabdus bovienii]MDE9479817.1 hypothetical protein [Xenorhabdus bovienii]MDE9532745.1 hypothetical protein [Xenorhabdus bovienii]